MRVVSKIQRWLKGRALPQSVPELSSSHKRLAKKAQERIHLKQDPIKNPGLRSALLTSTAASLILLAGSRQGRSQEISPLASTTTGTPTLRAMADRFVTPFNVRDFGAIGNGLSNPASTVYGSLAALQTAYGGTTVNGVTLALTQELDFIAHAAAIQAASVSGGVVYTPSSTYIMDNANSVSDGSGTLTFPTASPRVIGHGVSWLGDFPTSVVYWPVDLGLNIFAVVCAGRANGQSAGFFEGLWVLGHGCGGVLGATLCNMQGIGTNDRRSFTRMNVGGFKVGVNVVGGQALWQDMTIDGCYYGIYFDVPNSGNFSNIQFVRIVSQNSKVAALAVNAAASIFNCQFDSCFFGTCPFSIFKETNNGNPITTNFLGSNIFTNCQFELIGNALIGEDNFHTPPLIAKLSSLNSYDSGTGNVSLATSGAHGLVSGNKFTLDNVAGTGTDGVAALNANGYFTATSGTTGSTLNLTIAPGLTLSAVTAGTLMTRVSVLFDNQFNYPELIWDTFLSINFHITGVPAYAVVDVNTISGMVINGIAESFAWQPGTVAMFSAVNFVSGFNFYGDLGIVLTNCKNAVSPKVNVLVSPQSAWSNGTNIFADSGISGRPQWSGQVAFAGSSISVGQIVVYETIGGQGCGVVPSAGTSTEVPAGVVTYISFISALALIATSGTVSCSTSGAISGATLMETGAGGLGTTGTGNAPIGVVYSQVGTNSYLTTLRGLA